MNKTKFILLAALVGVVVLSCSLFDATDGSESLIGPVLLEKLPNDEASFQYTVAEKVADLYTQGGTKSTKLGKISFNGTGTTMTFDIEYNKHESTIETGKYETTMIPDAEGDPGDLAYANSMQYKAKYYLTNTYKVNDIIFVQATNISNGMLHIIYTKNDVNGTNPDPAKSTNKYYFEWIK